MNSDETPLQFTLKVYAVIMDAPSLELLARIQWKQSQQMNANQTNENHYEYHHRLAISVTIASLM